MSLNTAVHGIDSMLHDLVGEVDIVYDLEPELQLVEVDPGQLGQVLLNLASNARDAMDGHGTLRIATRNEPGAAVLEVCDTGAGMDAETQERIFEPFFTTKPIGQGTGLGLSTVYGVVSQSGGTIRVHSAPGEGAVFEVRLPATVRRAVPASLAAD
jgi:signal transduction histidine kinase